MVMRILLVCCVILGAGLWATRPTAAAQETPVPEAGEESGRYLPDAEVFGEGWDRTKEIGLQVPSDIFREGAMASYGGARGARIVVIVLLSTDSRVAIRQGWEQATETFDQYRYALASDYDYEQAERLEALEPPAGCVEAKRAEGTDRQYSFVAGLTMCAVDPDVILLATASGELNDEMGYAASDAVIDAALEAGGQTT